MTAHGVGWVGGASGVADFRAFVPKVKQAWQDAGKAMTAGLSCEGTHNGCFTGVYIGLYSAGGEARFKNFSLSNLPEDKE
jgi:hypothetical protein